MAVWLTHYPLEIKYKLMYLTSPQQTALDVLNQVILGDAPSASVKVDSEVASLKAYQAATRPDPDQMMLGAWYNDLGKELLNGLPKVITPEFKAHLRTLAAFDKAGANASEEQRQEAIAAYQTIGKTLKVAVAKMLISYGIRTGLADTPAAPTASIIANILSEPLARAVVATSDHSAALQRKLINIALNKMGKETIDPTQQDVFMARLIGKFAGSILEEIEKNPRLRSAAPREASYAMQEEQFVPTGAAFNR